MNPYSQQTEQTRFKRAGFLRAIERQGLGSASIAIATEDEMASKETGINDQGQLTIQLCSGYVRLVPSTSHSVTPQFQFPTRTGGKTEAIVEFNNCGGPSLLRPRPGAAKKVSQVVRDVPALTVSYLPPGPVDPRRLWCNVERQNSFVSL